MSQEATRKRRWRAAAAGGVVLVATAAILLASSLPGLAFGGRHRGHGPEFVLWKIDRMLGAVDATDDQRDEIEAIVETAMGEIRELRPDRKELQEELRVALTGEEVDRAQLESLRAEHALRMEAISQRIASTIGDVGSVLTQEQRIELADLMEERMHRFGRH